MVFLISPPQKKKEEKTPGCMGCFCTGLLQLSRCYALWRTHGRRDQGTLPHRKSELLEPPKATVLSSFSGHRFTMSFHFHSTISIILPAQGALSPSPSPSATATFSLMVPFAGSDWADLVFSESPSLKEIVPVECEFARASKSFVPCVPSKAQKTRRMMTNNNYTETYPIS